MRCWGSISVAGSRSLPSLKVSYIQHRLIAGNILEVGCGSGRILASINHPHPKYGVDISIEGLINSTSPAALQQADSEQLPFKDNSIYNIICCDTLEHVSNPHTTLSEIHRVLTPTGRAHLSIPLEHNRPYSLAPHIKRIAAGHNHSFTKQDIIRLLTWNRLTPISIHYSYHYIGSLLDMAFYYLVYRNPSTWVNNPFYSQQHSAISHIAKLANYISYVESSLLKHYNGNNIHITAIRD